MDKIARREWMLRSAQWFGSAAVLGAVSTCATQKQPNGSEGPSSMNEPERRHPPAISPSVLDRIGGTPLLELRHIVPRDHARILIKLESENPTGSMKDRMALAMIEAAEHDGRLKPGGTVVEYTGGSTGVALSLVCSVKGYPLEIVTSNVYSSEKRDHMAALGAKLTILESASGGIDAALIRGMVERARQITQRTGGFWTDQLNNEDSLSSYHTMGDEIWEQTSSRVDAFVQSVGTGGSLRGNAERLQQHNPDIHIVAVEPSESAVLSGQESGSHNIEGIGAGFVVPLWKPELATEIARVPTDASMEMARRLSRVEGVFAGTSTGTNLIAAIDKARQLGPGKTVVTVMVDTGMKYLSTPLYKNS